MIKLEDYGLHNARFFEASPGSIRLLSGPDEYYRYIANTLATASERIVLSSLYIGDGDLENHLMDVLYERLSRDSLKVTVALDGTRQSRSPKTLKRLTKLCKAFPDSFRLLLYRNSISSVFHKLNVGTPKILEAFGVSHFKFCIFDNDVLLTGANLSGEYFSKRLDRYLLIGDQPYLCDFLCKLLGIVHGCKSRKEKKGLLESILSRSRTEKPPVDSADSTMIFPVISVPEAKLHGHYEIFRLFLSKSLHRKVLLTPYFNPPSEICAALSNADIYTAAPSANSFFYSKGFTRLIPMLYGANVFKFLKEQSSSAVYEYSRQGWTYHAKGLFIELATHQLQTIGSSNFNYRSFYRDLELDFCLLSSNRALHMQNYGFINTIRRHSVPAETKPSLLERLLRASLHKFL